MFVAPGSGGAAQRITHDGRSSSPVWTSKGILVSHSVPRNGWGANEIWLVEPGGKAKSLSGPIPSPLLGSGITGLTPVGWSRGSLLAGLINEFGWPPFAVDPQTKTLRRIGQIGFGAVADGLSRDGHSVLVEIGNTEARSSRRVVALPFAGGKPRVIARFAGDASWNL